MTTAADLQKYVNGYGLVPCKILKSEAGVGFVENEIRGFKAEHAAILIDTKWVEVYTLSKEELAAHKRDIADSGAASLQLQTTGAATGLDKGAAVTTPKSAAAA